MSSTTSQSFASGPSTSSAIPLPDTKDQNKVKNKKRSERNKKKRQMLRSLTKKQKREYFASKATSRVQSELDKTIEKYKKQRQIAISFWKKWKTEERMTKDCSTARVKQIDKTNLIKQASEAVNLGEGVFGFCTKQLYRGIPVAVKEFKHSASMSSVRREAGFLNEMDHPNLPFLIGVCEEKPYLLVCQFHGVNGSCLTFAKTASQRSMTDHDEEQWRSLFSDCSEALQYLHNKALIHCDIKADNVLIAENLEGAKHAVLIDFGKVREQSKAKKYTLSAKEQEQYRIKYQHIAPEVVRGNTPPSVEGDVYSFGQLISFICSYHCFENLRLLAVKCIHGTPSKRPSLNEIIAYLESST